MHGRFVWHELMTSDPAAAAAFYAQVVGWTVEDSGMPGLDYRIASAGKDMVAGIMDMPPHLAESGARPHWLGYIGVDDVDAAAARLTAEGGAVHRAPEDIPGVGRFAVVSDPQGAVYCLFHASTPGAPTQPMATGHVGWNELMCGDVEEAMTFYHRLYDWQKDTAMDMGPLGTYQIFAVGGVGLGGMMRKPPEMPGPHRWQYYFTVEGLDGAGERVTAGGGQLLGQPMEVPGGAWIIPCLDPQGASFSLVSMAR
ncbi:glyoxalase [Rhizobium rhizosphaerae]|uniref:Glyoxalase n=1 Tax=Xaviernesmea rhizosphaerae TaxID=1672749 RepID=A0A1Q9AFL4_9HYPH|nr:VOC family protein [Xaviernesmea rhizosphaerae]OLP53750.1 glyoxalase [Xaviernesmea rhizosphaerae]